MNKILKHPLLTNPIKYLRSNKCHSSDLYETKYYDTSSINSNPFAKGLTTTKSNGQKTRFPVGVMIQLIVDKINGQLLLVPLINKPDPSRALFPSHYILNNFRLIDFIMKSRQWKRYIPQKFRFKNDPSVWNQVELLPNFERTIPDTYKNNIIKLMKDIKSTEKSAHVMKITNQGDIIKLEDSIPVINITKFINEIKIEEPVFINYKENYELCRNIILFINFYS